MAAVREHLAVLQEDMAVVKADLEEEVALVDTLEVKAAQVQEVTPDQAPVLADILRVDQRVAEEAVTRTLPKMSTSCSYEFCLP